jgi:hypothetical protein
MVAYILSVEVGLVLADGLHGLADGFFFLFFSGLVLLDYISIFFYFYILVRHRLESLTA